MKKVLSAILTGILCFSAVIGFTACDSGEPPADPTATPDSVATTPTAELPDVDPASVDTVTDIWVATELTFKSNKEYQAKADRGNGKISMSEASTVIMDAVFTSESGTVLTIPAFWDGDNVFKVRFAPTEHGVWNYVTKCDTDASLNGLTGKIGANTYKGTLEIYKHGFVTVEDGKKYFTYADGTPFFYIGDTHWSMLKEEFDEAGPDAGSLKTNSHFKYIVDKRVTQGFTVYQSEPIGHKYDLANGLTKSDIAGMQSADGYFQYIAEKGLTHANAQFFFSSELTKDLMNDDEYMELISRYWVARFGAYPVMWTLAQEIDNDFYYERGDQKNYDYTTNPWVKYAEYIHKYDAYSHPLTGHQETTGRTTVTGLGTTAKDPAPSGYGVSAFLNADSAVTGHNWWGAQWAPSLTSQGNEAVAKDYWNSPKVAINYEGRYCYLWTKNFGARAQGWISYLNGFMGYGYGAVDIWLYQSTYDIDKDSNDGFETITKADKAVKWSKAVEFESAYQVGYMRYFMEQIEWWKLVPDFNNKVSFTPKTGAFYACAADGNNTYVIYFYNQTQTTGIVGNMEDGSSYNARWYNPRTAEFTDIGTVTPDTFDSYGKRGYTVPDKPDGNDWVLILTKN